MISITVYDGAQSIGGNKIYVGESSKEIFIPRSINKNYSNLHNLARLKLFHHLLNHKFYRFLY